MLGTDYVSSLSAGSSSTETAIFDLSSSIFDSIPSGTYYIGAYADMNNTENEIDENNNDAAFEWANGMVVIGQSPSYQYYQITINRGCTDSLASNYNISANINDGSCTYPDLEITNEYYSSCLLIPCSTTAPVSVNGTVIDFNVVVTNIGSASASPHTLGYYLSANTTFSNNQTYDYLLGTDQIDGGFIPSPNCPPFCGFTALNLLPGGISNETATFDLSDSSYNNIPDGVYYIGAYVDMNYSQSESNEYNNDAAFQWSSPLVLIGQPITYTHYQIIINRGCTNPVADNYDSLANINDGSCLFTCTQAPYFENFDSGLGSWTNVGWTLDANGTTSSCTGPTDDITGGGNYMYYETSSGYHPAPVMISECLDISSLNSPALRFHYHMLGSSMGTLDVSINGTSVWSISGDQGTNWNLAQVDLATYANSDSIVIKFSGTYGGSFCGDMAFDNVEVDEYIVLTVPGCTDPSATNYNFNATISDSSCIYPPLNDDCINAVLINCNSSVVGNNTGASANANATFVGGPAIWYEVIGTGGDITISTCGTLFDTRLMVYDSCGTSAYIAYNDDFNCISGIYSATSTITFSSIAGANYKIAATGYNSSTPTGPITVTVTCSSIPIPGCIDSLALNYDALATVNDSSCCYNSGCTDITASNYDSTACYDDSSCVYNNCSGVLAHLQYTTVTYGQEQSFVITNSNGNIIWSVSGQANNTTVDTLICLLDDCYSITMNDGYGDGWHPNSNITITNSSNGSLIKSAQMCWLSSCPVYNGTTVQTDSFTVGSVSCDVYGCTDPSAINYNSSANVDDNSCCYISGCTDSTATNYDPSACFDDGSCYCSGTYVRFDYDPQGAYSSQQSFSIYNSSGTLVHSGGGGSFQTQMICLPDDCYSVVVDDSNCNGWWFTGLIAYTINPYQTLWTSYGPSGCSDTLTFALGSSSCTSLGCTDPLACNYDSLANTDDGSCTYPGCTDPIATNYDPTASCDDGSCYCSGTYITFDYDPQGTYSSQQSFSIYNSSGTLVHSGGGSGQQTQEYCLPDDCYSVVMDDSNCNGWWYTDLRAYTTNPYLQLWTSSGPSGCSDTLTFALGSSSCTSLGCTDPLACNYDSLANTDDGSCTYPGCTDPIATNYDPTASCDDGSCYCSGTYITFDYDPQGTYSSQQSFSIYNSSGTLVHSGGGSGQQTQEYCLPDDCYSVVMDDSNCNGWWYTDLRAYTTNPYLQLWTSSGPSGCSDTLTFALGSSSCTSLGCTDPLACNYDSLANTDDGSCTYPGCTDPIATNYDPTASCDDGSCYCSGTYITFDYDPQGTYSSQQSFSIYNSSGTLVHSGGGSGQQTQEYCLPDDCYSVVMDDSNCNGWWYTDLRAYTTNPYLQLWTSSGPSGCSDTLTFALGSSSCTSLGCTDPLACNYDSLANTDDGSCAYSSNIIQNVTACDAFIWNGTTYTQSGTYTFVTTNSFGCDSVATLNLNISNSSTSTTDTTVCDTFIWNGVVYTSSTVVSYLTTNASGCDSVATLNLTINNCTPVVCAEDAPTNLSATNVIQNRATINWDNMNSSVCLVDQYRIKFRPVGSSTWTQKTMGQPVGSCLWACNKVEKLILNLIPNTTYEYQMKAWYCGGGASAWTSLHTFTTAPECPNVGNLAVTTPTPTKATFTWDDSNGTYSFTRIKSRVDIVGSTWFNVGGTGVAHGTFTKNKNGLTPGESYRGQARTWCDPNGGAYKSPSWTSLIYWTQPTVRMEVGATISNLDVYPNPSRDMFNVTFTSEDVQDLEVRVINIIGEEIIKEDLQQFVGEYVKSINLNKYVKGVYFLEIETNNGIINKKLILQ